jgi:high-affinity nickel permease
VSDETAQKSTTPIGVTVEAAEEFVSALTTKQYAGMVGGGVAGIFLVVLGIIARVRTIKRLAKSGPIVMNF